MPLPLATMNCSCSTACSTDALNGRLLERDHYSFQWNVPYCHQLDSDRLTDALTRWLREVWSVVTTEDGVTRWTLTSAGGSWWELERCPRWDRFCSERYIPLRSGRTMIMVLSPCLATAELFWEVGARASLWKAGDGRSRCWQIHNYRWIPWHDFPVVHVLADRGASHARPNGLGSLRKPSNLVARITEFDSLSRRLK